MIALAIIFFAMGLFHIIRPDLIYRLTQSWKSYSDSDPQGCTPYASAYPA